MGAGGTIIQIENYKHYQWSFTDAQIRALASRAAHGSHSSTGDVFPLLPARAGWLWWIQRVLFFCDFSGGAYETLDENFNMGLCTSYELDYTTQLNGGNTSNIGPIFQSATKQLFVDSIEAEFSGNTASLTDVNLLQILSGQGIYAFFDNKGTTLTGGNADNRLIIQLDAVLVPNPIGL